MKLISVIAPLPRFKYALSRTRLNNPVLDRSETSLIAGVSEHFWIRALPLRNCFVQTVRRQVFKYGVRVNSISPGPVISALLADWPPEKLKEAGESGSLLEASEVASVVTFMLTRLRGMTIRDVVMLPTNFDL
jgi:hypothetical protein